MRWSDALSIAMRSAFRRFGRTALTVLAVALASALLVALATIVVTANSRVIRQISKGGPITAIKVLAAQAEPGQLDTDSARPGDPRDLDEDDRRTVLDLPGVEAAAPVLVSETLAVPPHIPRLRHGFFDTKVGVDPRQASELPVTVLAGRLPRAGSTTEVAVTQGYLDRLRLDADAPEQVLGSRVDLGAPQAYRTSAGEVDFRGRWTRLRVVGVVAQDAAPGQFLVPIEQTRADRGWTLAGVPADGIRYPTSEYSGLIVVASGLDRVHEVRSAITDLGYATSAPEQLVANVRRYLRVVDIVLGGIGLIALVIASLGVASALLAAVRERRREIGVLKAIGARDRDVLRWFLLEAGFVGLIGGAAGTAAGIGIATLVGAVVNDYLTEQGLEGVRLVVPWAVVAAGVLGATLLALLAGSWPARRAARLPAREAVGSL